MFPLSASDNVPLGFASGNIEGLRETKLTISLGQVIKYLTYTM